MRIVSGQGPAEPVREREGQAGGSLLPLSPPNLNSVASYLKLGRSLTLQKKIRMFAKQSPETFFRPLSTREYLRTSSAGTDPATAWVHAAVLAQPRPGLRTAPKGSFPHIAAAHPVLRGNACPPAPLQQVTVPPLGMGTLNLRRCPALGSWRDACGHPLVGLGTATPAPTLPRKASR